MIFLASFDSAKLRRRNTQCPPANVFFGKVLGGGGRKDAYSTVLTVVPNVIQYTADPILLHVVGRLRFPALEQPGHLRVLLPPPPHHPTTGLDSGSPGKNKNW